MLEQLKKQRRELRATLDRIDAQARKDKRAMTDDESTKFDELVGQIKALDERIKALEGIDEDDPDAEPRSRGVRSLPPGAGPNPFPKGTREYYAHMNRDNVRTRNPNFVPDPVGDPFRRSRKVGVVSDPINYSFGIHAGGDHERYSIHRAIECIASGYGLDGLEGELSQELTQIRGKNPNGFYMPLGADPEMRAAMGFGERRDLTTQTGAGGIFNEELGPMIDLLRARLVIRQLGARVLTGMRGLFSIPRQTGTGAAYWLGEQVPASLSNGSLDQIPFAPHVCIAATDISRMFTAQTSLDAERFTQDDLGAVMVRELDRVAINGTGGAQPTGILQTPQIKARAYALPSDTGNGGQLDYAATVKMKVKLATANADVGKIGWLFNPDMEGQLRLTPKVAPAQSNTVNPGFVWEDTGVEGQGRVGNYRALTSTLVPNNLTKGTSTNCSASILANWDDLVVALWEGVDVIVNPYTGQLAGTVRVSMQMVGDVQVRHYESFVINNTAVPAY